MADIQSVGTSHSALLSAQAALSPWDNDKTVDLLCSIRETSHQGKGSADNSRLPGQTIYSGTHLSFLPGLFLPELLHPLYLLPWRSHQHALQFHERVERPKLFIREISHTSMPGRRTSPRRRGQADCRWGWRDTERFLGWPTYHSRISVW